MAQLNLYVNDELAARLKREARKAGVPLSRYVVELLSTPKERGWPAGYFERTCGFLKQTFPEPADRLPEPFELPEKLRVSLHLLDTNIWIALAAREPGPVARLRNMVPEQVASCSVVRAELMFGARKSRRVAENLGGFRRLLDPFQSLPFDDAAAGHYGVVRATLERAGTPIGANDLLIASIALAHDCVLVTRDSGEFARVVGLRVEVWQ